MGHFSRILIGAATLVAVAAPQASAQLVPGTPDMTVSPEHLRSPVVLKGSDLAGWAAPANQTARLPLVDLLCWSGGDGSVPNPTTGGGSEIGEVGDNSKCPHSHYAEPDFDTADLVAPEGAPVDRLIGYRWDPGTKQFVQVPFQVDEVFTRYLNNERSGFSVYSGEDQHTTYAYDREGFRFRLDGTPEDPCTARADSPPATDPVKGLDANDEISFMGFDSGPVAPAAAPLPAGIKEMKEIRVQVPGKSVMGYAYIGLADAGGPRPKFTGADGSGHVSYKRDARADTYAFSQSSYDS